MTTQLHTPMYLLRRHMVLHAIGHDASERFLEIGCGRGDLLVQLAQRGFEGVGIEISPEALTTAKAAAAEFPRQLHVFDRLDAVAGQMFDLVMAFEVLEHVPDDGSTLHQWAQYVAPGGRFLLSVPAHMRKWTRADEFGGHLRRYERAQLEELVEGAGLAIDDVWTYGFPLSSVTRRARNLAYRRRAADVATRTPTERTLASSFDSTRSFRGAALAARALELAGRVGHAMQLAFRNTELGEGFLVAAHRPA